MATPLRKYTNKIWELIDDGLLDKDVVLTQALNWMSEADVEEFVIANDFIEADEDEEAPDYDEDE